MYCFFLKGSNEYQTCWTIGWTGRCLWFNGVYVKGMSGINLVVNQVLSYSVFIGSVIMWQSSFSVWHQYGRVLSLPTEPSAIHFPAYLSCSLKSDYTLHSISKYGLLCCSDSRFRTENARTKSGLHLLGLTLLVNQKEETETASEKAELSAVKNQQLVSSCVWKGPTVELCCGKLLFYHPCNWYPRSICSHVSTDIRG